MDALEDAVYQQGRASDQVPSQICRENRSAAASLLQEGLELLLEKLPSQATERRTPLDTSDNTDDVTRQVTQGTRQALRPPSYNKRPINESP